MARNPITVPVETLRELLILDAEAGQLFWRHRGPEWFPGKPIAAARWNGRNAGKEALCYEMTGGYLGGTILGRGNIRAHRVIWAMHTGAWPADFIDHINGDLRDNRICNLRESTLAQNHCNRAPKAGSSSRYLGVYWSASNNGWVALIKSAGRKQHLGTFRTEDAAAVAYNNAAVRLHGQFARPNEVAH